MQLRITRNSTTLMPVCLRSSSLGSASHIRNWVTSEAVWLSVALVPSGPWQAAQIWLTRSRARAAASGLAGACATANAGRPRAKARSSVRFMSGLLPSQVVGAQSGRDARRAMRSSAA